MWPKPFIMNLKASVTTVIHSTIDQVWEALVDPKDIAQYMMGVNVTTDWKEGSAIQWKGNWQGKDIEEQGRVLSVREPELLKYSHRSNGATGDPEEHIITIELQEAAGVTHLRLTQDNNASEEACAQAEKNWTLMLDGLKMMLGEAPMPKPEEARV